MVYIMTNPGLLAPPFPDQNTKNIYVTVQHASTDGKRPIVYIRVYIVDCFPLFGGGPTYASMGGYGKLWQHRGKCPDSSTNRNQIKFAEP